MMPRIVIDTDVHVNALPSHKSPDTDAAKRLATRAALTYATENFCAVETPETQRELARIMLRTRYDDRISRATRRDYLTDFSAGADQVKFDPAIKMPHCPDPKDVPFINAAQASGAQYLLSYNYNHINSIGTADNTLLIKPAQFLLLENQGARMGVHAPTKVVETNHPDLLELGHAGSSVFLTAQQARLTRGHAIEVVPAIPLQNPHHGGLKKGEAEGYLMVTDNPDILALNNLQGRDKKVTLAMATGAYAMMQNHLSTNPQQFAADLAQSCQDVKGPQPTVGRIKQFTAGRHGLQ